MRIINSEMIHLVDVLSPFEIAVFDGDDCVNNHTVIVEQRFDMYNRPSNIEILNCFREKLESIYDNNWILDLSQGGDFFDATLSKA